MNDKLVKDFWEAQERFQIGTCVTDRSRNFPEKRDIGFIIKIWDHNFEVEYLDGHIRNYYLSYLDDLTTFIPERIDKNRYMKTEGFDALFSKYFEIFYQLDLPFNN